MAPIATRNVDCVGFENYNRPIGDPHLQDENRMNRVVIPMEMSVAFTHAWSASAVSGRVGRAHSCSGIVTARQ
jgi:hypothetical protein